ncbi:MAG TPA: HAMP domain-containing protein [Roseiflexaceae bacterium]|nr:HAMP domain-containing protein [Roseiflexaceae bacterium]
MAQTAMPSLLTRSSIQRHLIVLLLIVGLVPLLLMAVVSSTYTSTVLEHQIGNTLDDIARNAMDQVDRTMFDSSNDVQTFAGSAEARSLDPTRIRPLMVRLQSTYGSIYPVMIVTDHQGVVRAGNATGDYATLTTLQSRLVDNEEWFRVWIDNPLPDGQTYISDLHHEPMLDMQDGTSGRVVAFSYPIRGVAGETLGVWAIFLDWREIQDTVRNTVASSLDDAHTLGITLINTQGTVLMAPNEQDVLNRQISLTEDHQQTLRDGTIDERFGRSWFDPALLSGMAPSRGYSSYHGLGWATIASQSREEARAPVYQLLAVKAGFVLLAILGVVALGTIAGRATARPIKQLTAAATRAAEGDLGQRVMIDRGDEIGQLGQAFNHMVAQLHEAQETLETRIEERTASLQTTLQRLQESVQERDMLSDQLLRSSIPLIPLVDHIAVLPIVGALDSSRIRQMQDQVLTGIGEARLRTVLMDITAVPIVDSQVALALIQTAQSAALLGCRMMLVGIRPEVAQTMVQLGLHFGDIATYATLQAALVDLLGSSGALLAQRAYQRAHAN